ncbi:hypothetical protein EYF80_037997 [Liparis tanakae]|uniref:Uncharacterized protein n=1 Tax=Liparis tanakae TaxID=230148 RepID=A0A4Z2GEM6_9TELE|nr:hypothetical protein EYF80_037997 [Liparis tanakae]
MQTPALGCLSLAAPPLILSQIRSDKSSSLRPHGERGGLAQQSHDRAALKTPPPTIYFLLTSSR